MANLKTRVTKLESADQGQRVIVIELQRGETDEQAMARVGVPPAKPGSNRLVVFLNWFCDDDEPQSPYR